MTLLRHVGMAFELAFAMTQTAAAHALPSSTVTYGVEVYRQSPVPKPLQPIGVIRFDPDLGAAAALALPQP
jgi:hypothetical protein